MAPNDTIDVLIVTAVKDEVDAVLNVGTGALPGTEWKCSKASTDLELFTREFESTGGTLMFAVTRALGMGREHAVMAAAPLLGKYPHIRCLAMCGVCAGRRGDVNLGDVIIADRSWPYDAGKLRTLYVEGERTERFQGDMDLYRIHPHNWKQLAERFYPPSEATWIAQRPRSYEIQGEWLLERLFKEEDPFSHSDRLSRCPDYEAVLKQLWKVNWIVDGELTITEAGKKHIGRLLHLHPGGLPEADPFKVHVGPIASGAPVVEDPEIFDRLSDNAAMRKILGVEMESSAILALAYLQHLPYAVVMKGVMDHADSFKSDNMKHFSAQASAECLVAFIRQNMLPQESQRSSISYRSPTADSLAPSSSVASQDSNSAHGTPLVQVPVPPPPPNLRLDDDFHLDLDDAEVQCFTTELLYRLERSIEPTFAVHNGVVESTDLLLSNLSVREPEDRIKRVKLLQQRERAVRAAKWLELGLPVLLQVAPGWALPHREWAEALVRSWCNVAYNPARYSYRDSTSTCRVWSPGDPPLPTTIEFWRKQPHYNTKLTTIPQEQAVLESQGLTTQMLMIPHDVFEIPSPLRAVALPLIVWNVLTEKDLALVELPKLLEAGDWYVGLG